MDLIHFHSFSRILLLIWKYPSVENFSYERAQPFLETLNYLELQKFAEATESFGRCLKIGSARMSWDKKEVVLCLLIPCCFLVGISNSGDSSLQKSFKEKLILDNTYKHLGTHPCAAFINMSTRFLRQVLEINKDPANKVKNYTKNLGFAKCTSYISERGKIFLELYMSEFLLDYCMYCNASEEAKSFYKSNCESGQKFVHGRLWRHVWKKQLRSSTERK